MNITAKKSTVVHAAESFYHWVRGEPASRENFDAIRSFLGADLTADELQRLEERIRGNQGLLHRFAPIIERWAPRIGSGTALQDSEAAELLGEFFNAFDHALLYDRGLNAGTTHIRRGRVSHGDKTFVGEMPCWTLHFTVSGSALFLSDTMEKQTRRGDLMLLKPEASYHYGLHPRSEDWFHLWSLFQPRQHWSDLLQWDPLDDGILYLSLGEGESCDRIEALFRDVIAMRKDPSAYRTELQYNRLEELLIRALESRPDRAEPGVDARVKSACDFMLARLDSRIVVDDVADNCNLSPSRLAHLFKEQMGCGPKAWINNMRLQRARKLLLATDDSIAVIGSSVGFDDAAHFTRHFKKNVGCSPRQFRQSFGR